LACIGPAVSRITLRQKKPLPGIIGGAVIFAAVYSTSVALRECHEGKILPGQKNIFD
jgi:hypothetical protein